MPQTGGNVATTANPDQQQGPQGHGCGRDIPDLVLEATLGFITLSVVGYGVYRWLF